MLSSWVLADFLAISLGGNVAMQMVSLLSAFVLVVIASVFVVYREKRIDTTN
jgi:hypothetical protein